jgi:tetratricopeptide (TPR) repeat protein
MLRDNHGLAVSTDSREALAALERTLEGFLKYRTDTARHLKAALAADPECALLHCLQGYFGMLAFNEALVPRAADAARKARLRAGAATARERAHVEALEAWIAADLERTLERWEAILAENPRDVLAFRLAHFLAFWMGRPKAMRASVDRILPAWGPDLPAWGSVLGCRCFAYEEAGDYSAEADGRKAVELDPADLWATHAVAHVMEMQGRTEEGIAWLQSLEHNWDGANNVVHHVWWHRAMFHVERREPEAALHLYDRRFRNLQSELTQAQPDLYIDIQNAASMLFRLERLGVSVGARWEELADKAQARIGDHRSAFTLPHWMMALAAAGRRDAAQHMLLAMRDYGRGTGLLPQLVGQVAVPVCEAVLAHRLGRYAEAVAAMRPVLDEMYRLGGSHAQQDVLHQLYLESALRAGMTDEVRRHLQRRAATFPMPLSQRVGYAGAIQLHGQS